MASASVNSGMAEIVPDTRPDFIAEYTQKSLRLKPERWAKFLQSEENKKILQDFLDKTDPAQIVIGQNAAGQLSVSTSFPTGGSKSKSIFFMKRDPGPIPKDKDIKSCLVFGDLSPTPLDQLTSLLEHVIIPLLSVKENHEGWPKVVSEDIKGQVLDLKGTVHRVLGQLDGKTLLPLPIDAGKIAAAEAVAKKDPSKVDYELKASLEKLVTKWSSQIQEVLVRDSGAELEAGNHPTPMSVRIVEDNRGNQVVETIMYRLPELDFWREKTENLQCIYDQLKNPTVRQMASLLEKTNSAYYPSFKSMFRNVVAGLAEAQDISMHLKPLQAQLNEITMVEFPEITPLLRPLLLSVGLAFAHSNHYSSPKRITVLIRQICNLIIFQAKTYLDPQSVFHGEVDESLDKVRNCLAVLRSFKSAYDEQKAAIPSLFGDKPPKLWDFRSDLVFGRMMAFTERAELIEKFFVTVKEFYKLEKVEIGGIRGRVLSGQVVGIFKEFSELYATFGSKTYDCLDPEDCGFLEDYEKFKEKILDLDLRLAMILCQAFDDCTSSEAAFKMLNLFSGLLERPVIKQDFESRYSVLVKIVNKEMDSAKLTLDSYLRRVSRDRVVVHRNMPPTAGALQWTRELKDQFTLPVKNLDALEHRCKDTEQANLARHKCAELERRLTRYEAEIFERWKTSVMSSAVANLRKSLIVRDPVSKELKVNFDPDLAVTLKEAKYLRDSLGYEDIPDVAVKLYDENDNLVTYTEKLESMADKYNKVRTLTKPQEFALIRKEVEDIDRKLESAETDLNWESPNLDEYVQSVLDDVTDLAARIKKCKENAKVIRNIMLGWSKMPLWQRKDGKIDTLLSLEDRQERLSKRYKEMETAGQKIKSLMQECKALFKADPSSKEWISYEQYIDEMVMNGLVEAMRCSFYYLLEHTETQLNPPPLFEARLELLEPDVEFKPSLDLEAPGGFFDTIRGLTEDIFNTATLIPRVASTVDQPHYLKDMRDMEKFPDLSFMAEEMSNRVKGVMKLANKYRQGFDTFSYLWTDDREDYLRDFLSHESMEDEQQNQHVSNSLVVPDQKNNNGGNQPDLQQFKKQIDRFEQMHQEAEKIETQMTFQSWFVVNLKPFRQSLLNCIRKWSFMFKQYLISTVTEGLGQLDEFINVATEGLSGDPEEGDYDALVRIMSHLMRVRDREDATDAMFEPLHQAMELLKNYDEDLPEEVHLQFQELPERWNTLKRMAQTKKQQVASLQSHELNNIRHKISAFEEKQTKFREAFKRRDFFKFQCDYPYELLDETHQKVGTLETEMQALHESAALFEVTVPEFKQLKQCRKDLKMLKQLWDYIHVILATVEAWKHTKWGDINCELLDTECKKFSKDILGLDKAMRDWEVWRDLEKTLRNIQTALRAVFALQNPAIRLRHWQQLMHTTNRRSFVRKNFQEHFIMDADTTLSDLLALELHKHEEEVKNIVDKASKEMSMEKILKDLNSIWAELQFQLEEHPRTKLQMLKISDEAIETLEENQVQLQNLMTSKYIDYFLKEISSWQNKLSTTDQVLTTWFEVQRNWSHLESIFIGSEDIRVQLPTDTERFDEIDESFKMILEKMMATLNIVEATNQAGIHEELSKIKTMLAICEKALQQYLETKRLVFPRFYFLSQTDLLDILSNGNQPHIAQKHLSKMFDSVARLEFAKDKDGNIDKTALAMISKEGEYVKFSQPCECTGPIEVWLNRLLETMRSTVRWTLGKAVHAYDERPRELWVFDFPAQVALTGTQIWWTAEVSAAFSKLEEGYDNAMKDYYKKHVTQLNALIQLLLGELKKLDREKIKTICTIDVHARDIVNKMIQAKVESASAFLWQSQLRHRWDDLESDCFANICDAQFRYDHEYLGNQPRLVITPLTDRCYITLTQSLHLVMGGGPAGPAGTGKTETTKDLGRALGMMVYVFNCSEQMDYKSCANTYKGLAQSGAWGCFDEFNRISVEVLSVVAVQVKSIQDAIRDNKKTFLFFGEEISLRPTVGIFITMNPGYAGRTELPENLKALFRPCAMVVPDFEMICENFLISEGFMEARTLAKKFISLYSLCKELLSKQDHYDWGLRAIKSVLCVAGKLRRDEPNLPEDQVLMRALRDFNIPKIITEDIPIFMGLVGDLFPAMEVPRKRNVRFEEAIKKAATDLKLQPEDGFILKVIQLVELLEVRHSVFIVGNAGTGKSQVWRTLFKTYQNLRLKPVYFDMNPKVVTNDELFGVINPATREWRDGLLSHVMRNLYNLPGDGPKWIVLDGDIDPMWIESLNTVMDDNKVLTLASNERIPLTENMRMVFEISHLRYATPATVSRAGILYINQQDLGWNPYVTSWIESREHQSEKAQLMILFDKYVPACLEVVRSRMKKITPIVDISHIQMLCHLLDCLLTPQNTPPDCSKELYEVYFVFACVWSFGSALLQDQLLDHRAEFSKWWMNEFKAVRFPPGGTVFDYYIDPQTKKFHPWSEKVSPFELDPDVPLQASLVYTAESARLRYFVDLLVAKRVPVCLVGNSGSGKSLLVQERLATLPGDQYIVVNVPLNFYTTSEMLQRVLEKPLEKKAGRAYGPPGNKRIVYFIDDLNMPEVDKFGTVQPHTLIRQHLDYRHWYDRGESHTLKDIHNVQYVACMNPTAGSFSINSRLQRHFCVFAVSTPSQDSLFAIYNQILTQHLGESRLKFSPQVQKIGENIVRASLSLQQRISSSFLPTALKFHYIFNMRDLSNLFQGLLFSTNECLKQPVDLVRLWMHEAQRVYCDKLVDEKDIENFTKILHDTVKKHFEDMEESKLTMKPNIYCHFALGAGGDPKYMPIPGWEHLHELLMEALTSYNEMNAQMNLVLFEDAMLHVCRINRILVSPRGNALLVGVGGSGKQSLARLAAHISSLEVFQISLRKGYGIPDLKADLAGLYLKAGLRNMGTVLLITDAQIADEKFLVLINDLLASGEIPDLFPDDEVDNIVSQLRNEVKSTGMPDTKENCWRFFIERVRRQLKVVLCFSPVGSTLRVRARKFPAIINATSIDWFHEWPPGALISVSQKFLSELECLPEDLFPSVSKFMAFSHTTVNDMSKVYLQNERRFNYTTPKSFLELINLYSKLLIKKNEELQAKITRLESGLRTLESTSEQVSDLKERLAVQEVEMQKKNEAASLLLENVMAESTKVAKEKEKAEEEQKKVAAIKADVETKHAECKEDLAEAEPLLEQAERALDTLNKGNLTELKSFGSPPEAVINVCAAVLVFLANPTPAEREKAAADPKPEKSEKAAAGAAGKEAAEKAEKIPEPKVPKDRSWKSSKNRMGKVDQFLHDLKHYDKDNIHPAIIKNVKPYLSDENFNVPYVQTKSAAAAGLCMWVINMVAYYEVYCKVKPKRDALDEAQKQLEGATRKKEECDAKVAKLEAVLAKKTAEFEMAQAEKNKCEAEFRKTRMQMDLANRLVNGLGSENDRWAESVTRYRENEKTLPGDVLLISAFISYVGCFSKQYRQDLMEKKWLPFLNELQMPIPTTPGLDPLSLLTDDATVAQWNNDGLPSDRMSTENATILTNSERWPLMIDPQLQGIKWVKNKYGASLKIVRLGQKGFLEILEEAISAGDVVLIENIGESLDPVLDTLLGRNTIKKGKAIKLGEKEVEYNENFRLILHTKLANPHYKPEMQAQTTLINFTVTRDGLEDQLLAEVVRAERPDLEEQKAKLTKQQNDYKIMLKQLEDELLARLTAAGSNILQDEEVVVNLENTKQMSEEVAAKVVEGKETAKKIDIAREVYRPAASRASLLYFILNELNTINPIYQFSLKAFSVVFQKAIERAEPTDEVKERVLNLIDCITYSVFMYTTRGLFECDKLIFTTQMAFQVLLMSGEVTGHDLDLLLRFPLSPCPSPVDFLSDTSWGAVKMLASMDEYRNLDRDIEGSAKRWKKFVESETPEKEKFPQEWKNRSAIQKLCMMRALRPDRMTYALLHFVEDRLGNKYVEGRSMDFAQSFSESGPSTPIFFILSPGVNPLKDVEKLGRKLGFSADRENFHNISLGQGQESVAEKALEAASKSGHWVVLQNIHLVRNWLPRLEKKLEKFSENSHPDYRVFMSAEPAPNSRSHIIPQGLLESSIKITNEPPSGMYSNLHKALDNFNQDTLDKCTKETEFKCILFCICYFHAVVCERKKFGFQGWNRNYPFNTGDLLISADVLYNYLEANNKVPWEDLRYLFGEIMYGGHITDDWDRRLCRTYLEEYLQPEVVDGELFLAPAFSAPPNLDYAGYHQYIDDRLPPESPYLYGLHPNAEIGFLTTTSEMVFKIVFEMQPRGDAGASGMVVITKEEKVKAVLDEIAEKLSDEFNMNELMGKVEEKTPYVVVALQECQRMNVLTKEMRRSLRELDLGLKGELTITADMEELSSALFLDQVPASWAKKAYPSMLSLGPWYADLLQRIRELESWSSDFILPGSVWLGGLFNPQSFLTAIMQTTARRNELPLDKMCLHCDVTKKQREDFPAPPREGAYLHGLYMEGARWDLAAGTIADSRMKELFPAMPVIYVKAIQQDKQETKHIYECPVYKTRQRGPTFVWTFNLKTKERPNKWILAGVALVLQV